MNPSFIWYKIVKKTQGSAKKGCVIHKDAKIEAGSTVYFTSMGKYSYCGYDCKIIHANIGAFCSIADNVTIGGAMHPQHWVSTSPAFYYGRDSISKRLAKCAYDNGTIVTTIGNDVWIGDGVFIKGGVTIGDGAIIGMGSIVTKDVPAYAIVAGNPAKLIRQRFDQTMSEQLLALKWWEWTDEMILQYSEHFNNPEALLREVTK